VCMPGHGPHIGSGVARSADQLLSGEAPPPTGRPAAGRTLRMPNLLLQRAMLFDNYGRHTHAFCAKPTGFSWDWLDFPGAMTAAFCIVINGTFLCGLRGLPEHLNNAARLLGGGADAEADAEAGRSFGPARRMRQVAHHPAQNRRGDPRLKLAEGGETQQTQCRARPAPPQPSKRPLLCPAFWRYQAQARRFYTRTDVELFVAALIAGSFLANVVQLTIDPSREDSEHVFWVLELTFNIAFTIELALNMYAFWCYEFWHSAWNIFDFVVVGIGLLTTFHVASSGPLNLLRMMRAFRIFRLFKRVKSLKKIMKSLAQAVPGVVNAFVIILLVQSVYAMLAVEFWSTYGEGGFFINENGAEVELVTNRGQDFGFEYFGNYPKAMYTLFQVMTGESWSEAIARPLLHTPSSFVNFATSLYFVSYQMLCATVLINVVIAVLLDKMVGGPSPEASPTSAAGTPPDELRGARDAEVGAPEPMRLDRQVSEAAKDDQAMFTLSSSSTQSTDSSSSASFASEACTQTLWCASAAGRR